MSQIQKGIFGVLALGVTLGAVQLASGHDLIGGQQVVTTPAIESTVNRAAKADRSAVPATGPKSQTFAMKFDGLPDTSVLVRVPATKEAAKETLKDEARNRPVSPARTRPGDSTRKLACEPVVSVLTEVAKLLQPGRCIT